MKFPDLSDAACKEVGTHFYYPEDKGMGNTIEDKIARSICEGCPVRIPCAEWGIHHERHGIWGGLSETQRRAARKARGIVMEEVLMRDYI